MVVHRYNASLPPPSVGRPGGGGTPPGRVQGGLGGLEGGLDLPPGPLVRIPLNIVRNLHPLLSMSGGGDSLSHQPVNGGVRPRKTS